MSTPVIIDHSGIWGGRVILFDVLPSTNQWILENTDACINGDIVVALHQVSGRGRFEREWISPSGKCLTLSAVIRPDQEKDSLIPYLCQSAALATRSAIAEFGLNAMVKWPNDVLVNNCKIAGILAERDPASNTIAMGIGINVNFSKKDIAAINLLQPATSISNETNKTFKIEDIQASLIIRLEHFITDLWENGLNQMFKIWNSYDFLTDKNITVQTADSHITGNYKGLDEDGKLTLIDKKGLTHSFWSGDVSLSMN